MQKVTVEYLRGHIISKDIEDVEYVEISDQESTSTRPDHDRTENPPKYDGESRAKEIYDYAKEQASKCDNGDVRKHLVLSSMIIIGANWSDENPVSFFCSDEARHDAFMSFVDELYKGRTAEGPDKSHTVYLLYLLSMTMGFKWATANPPKYY